MRSQKRRAIIYRRNNAKAVTEFQRTPSFVQWKLELWLKPVEVYYPIKASNLYTPVRSFLHVYEMNFLKYRNTFSLSDPYKTLFSWTVGEQTFEIFYWTSFYSFFKKELKLLSWRTTENSALSVSSHSYIRQTFQLFRLHRKFTTSGGCEGPT